MMFRRSIFRAGIFNVALLILLSKYTIGYNEVTIVGLFPVVKAKDEYTNIVDVSGVKRLAAAKMAIDHINNKNDGYYDDDCCCCLDCSSSSCMRRAPVPLAATLIWAFLTLLSFVLW